MSVEREVASQIKRGFLWLGVASAAARVLDALSTLGVLWFVSREEMGLATLSWSVAVFLEAFNGLGIATALVQAPKVDEHTFSDAFWYTMAWAVALVLGVCLAAPWLASFWGAPTLVPLIRVSALKLLFVGAALVPLQIMNRHMRFERIAAATTLATLGAALCTLTLAFLGLGAWALVLGQTVYGIVLVVAAYALEPYTPRFDFSPARVKPLALFGTRVATSGVLYNLYRNADYFFLGRFLGVAAVGVYRVGFDLAMTPTLAVLNVVNRAALPGYAKLQSDREALSRAFCWTLRSLGLMLAPVTALLVFGARDVLSLVDKGRWLDAAEVTAWLAWAGLLRSLVHLFPQLFHAVGRPGLAVLDSVVSGVVLSALFAASLALFGREHGVVVLGWAWLVGAPLLFAVLWALAKGIVPLSARVLVATIAPWFLGLLVLGAIGLSLSAWLSPATPVWVSLPVRVTALSASYLAYLRFVLKMRWADVWARKPASSEADD